LLVVPSVFSCHEKATATLYFGRIHTRLQGRRQKNFREEGGWPEEANGKKTEISKKDRVHCFSTRVVMNKCFFLNPKKKFVQIRAVIFEKNASLTPTRTIPKK